MLNKMKTLVVAAAILAANAAVEVTPANAAYMHGMGHGWNGGGNWRGGGCCGGGDWWGPAIGFGAGLAFGSLLAQPYYGGYYAPYYGGYYAPRYSYAPRSSSSVAYCQARFRSYNVATRTYVGYDGMRHYC